MKVLLGMSGGLDSTYAALALREAGHEVTGAVLQMHEYTDLAAAQNAARQVGIPLLTIDMREGFDRTVKENFAAEYLHGRTPNPCVICNRRVKFEGLLSYALLHGYDRIATGHYCRVVCEGGRWAVGTAADVRKDQSYVLWSLTQEQLSRLLLPLSDARKDEIRTAAAARGLSAASAEESMEICFIPDHDYAAFLEARCGKLPEGDFLDTDGKVIGRHRGICHYTVGQRKHLGIALGTPVYVSAIDPVQNTVTLARADGVGSDSMRVSALRFQCAEPQTSGSVRARVKVRYAAPAVPCTVTFDGTAASVVFDAPVRAVTPGQSAVFYRADGVILFGGVIA